ncbi:MAG: helix-turn-helix domain-containing protein [Polaromonas sp.]|nr:helix-turn-helix domain-containing protein [Polaromonas sp.]MDP3750518.1 helix-turn-helix domain-containing protein [Polaromonas sp.]
MNDMYPSGLLPIGALAERCGLSVSAIRYYEEVGLIPAAMRKASGHRVYGSDAQEVLTLIRHCRDFGFSIEDTRALVSLAASEERSCAEARDIAQVHLDAVRAKLAELQALQTSLARFVKSCGEQCIGGPAPKCSILKDISLADPAPAVRGGCCT